MDLADAGPLLLTPFIGSFLTVLVRRLPRRTPLLSPPSQCDICEAPLEPRDLMPIISFISLDGCCRHCRAPIPSYHWQVEIGATLVAIWALFADPEHVLVSCIFGWTLLTLSWIDWQTRRLPDRLTIPLLAMGLGVIGWGTPEQIGEHAAAAAVGYAFIWSGRLMYRRLRGREGIGLGDAKLLAALGAWVGIQGLPSVLLGAAIGGILLIFATKQASHNWARRAIPFGPCLAAAAWLVWLYGPFL